MTTDFFDTIRDAAGLPAKTAAAPAGTYAGPATFAGDIDPYAAAALNAELAAVAGAPAGTRNDTLNIAAVKLGSLVAGGALPPRMVYDELRNAALAAGLEESEIRATLNSGLRKGEETPRTKPETNQELDRWLNTVAAAPAPLPASANGNGVSQSPTTAPPTPENGTQPLPWETAPTSQIGTAGPSAPGPTTPPAKTAPGLQPPANGANSVSPTTTESPNPTQPGTTQTDAEITAIPPHLLAQQTAVEYLKLKSRDDAIRLHKKQNNAAVPPPRITLTDFLAQPDEEAQYRVHGLWPEGGRVVLAAQYKAGKTSMVGNLIKALADDGPFLGQFRTEPVRKIVLIDDEMAPNQIRRWYRDQNIHNTDALDIIALRGALSTFDILDPVTRGEWAAKLAGADIIILDCLRPVLDALGLDENRDAGKFLAAFDELLKQASTNPEMPAEALVVHHMGHGGNRSRGDSRILDWPDATWTLKRENAEDPTSPRYFEALGRDVKVSESLIEWTEETRALVITGGNRRDVAREARTEDYAAEVIAIVKEYPGVSQRSVFDLIRGAGSKADDKTIRATLGLMVDRGEVNKIKRTGRGGGYAYYPASPPPTPKT